MLRYHPCHEYALWLDRTRARALADRRLQQRAAQTCGGDRRSRARTAPRAAGQGLCDQRSVRRPHRHRRRASDRHRHLSARQTPARDQGQPRWQVAIRGAERLAERRTRRGSEDAAASRSQRGRNWRSRHHHAQGEAHHPRRQRPGTARHQRRRSALVRRQRRRRPGQRRRRAVRQRDRDREDGRRAGRRHDSSGRQGRVRDE